MPGSQAQGSQLQGASVQVGAQVQLDQLQLANRASALARVSEVVRQSQDKAEQLVLEIRGRTLSVNSAIGETRLQAGDWVKVMRAGNELQLLGKLAPAPQAQLALALAQRLPWQHRLDTGLNQLMAALTPAVGQATALAKGPELTPAAQQAIAKLMAGLPTQGNLAGGGDAAAGIKQWLAESGLFAETRLARGGDPLQSDFKLALGRVVSALLASQGEDSLAQLNRLTPLTSPELVQAPLQFPTVQQAPAQKAEMMSVGQMLRMLAGMLNRVSVNQLHSQALSSRAPADGAAPATWVMELPWLNTEAEPRLAQLRLEHYEKDAGPERAGARKRVAEWRLTLAIDLDEMGPLYFEVALRQHQLSAQVWAERQSTLDRVASELGHLRQGLNELGLEVVDLECHKGQPEAARTQLEHRLVDIKA